jgi:hypothetical protein
LLLPKNGFRVIGMLLALGIMTAPWVFGFMSHGATAEAATTSAQWRLAIWAKTCDVIAQHPLYGAGLGALRTMRDAIPKSGLNESAAEETFQGMFDKEVSLAMAKRNSLGLADMLVKHMPDPNATQPSTAQMLQARQPKAMPLQAPPASPMALQAAAPALAPLPKPAGAMPLTGISAASPTGLTITNSQATDGAKP